ncbi:sugar phosphate isomerase/epimerase [bacterium]|nr:sugar phosphate isomerase/epimerase [bacterium]
MKNTMTRRKALAAGAASAGILTGTTGSKAEAYSLEKTWGDDFLTPWSPPATVKRDLKPGSTPIRLSCTSYGIHYSKDGKIGDNIKQIRDMGYTAGEGNDEWKQASDSEIRELHDALKTHDVWFYALHICINNIHPDLSERQKNIKRVAEMVQAAERLGLSFVVTHTGSRDDSPTKPHRDNWTKETWDDSVKAIRQIIKDTAGSKVNLGVEALNPCNINNPKAHVRLREDVGDPRVKVTLDPTNMLNTNDYYRTTELINECFGLLGEDILYAHAKDVLWLPDMLPAFKWVIPGTGTMDYETYLVNLSRLKYTRPLLLEFLPTEQYPQAKKFIEDTAAKVGVKIYRQA